MCKDGDVLDFGLFEVSELSSAGLVGAASALAISRVLHWATKIEDEKQEKNNSYSHNR